MPSDWRRRRATCRPLAPKSHEDLRGGFCRIGTWLLNDPVDERLNGRVVIDAAQRPRDRDLHVDVVVRDVIEQDGDGPSIPESAEGFGSALPTARALCVQLNNQVVEGIRHRVIASTALKRSREFRR